jgi:hypothetical protein
LFSLHRLFAANFPSWFADKPCAVRCEVLITPACLASTLDVAHSAPHRGRLFWSLADTAVAAS